MGNRIFIFTGVILIIVGVIVYQSDAGVRISGRMADPGTASAAKAIIGGGLGVLGILFSLGGLIGLVRGSKQNKRSAYILQTGVAAEGTVTFVDKNYSILVNKKPIYSIIEYTYNDSNGTAHTRKVNTVNSDMVIRNQIQVGSKIAIKYAADNPAESVFILKS